MFPAPRVPVPAVTAAQMLEVDRLMVEVYGIALLQMMEHAGRSLARVARTRFFDGDLGGRHITVLSGTGGNGGGGLVAARHLHTAGAEVRVIPTKPAEAFGGVPAHHLTTLREMGLPLAPEAEIPADAELLIDALIGYSLEGSPRGRVAALIAAANAHPAPVLSLDLPSGVDATTGEAFDPHIEATATVTLALPKTGLGAASGEVFLADIGVPHELYGQMGLAVEPLFAQSDILRL